MTLAAEDIEAIADRVVAKQAMQPAVLSLAQAMTYCGFGSKQGFYGWTSEMGVVSMYGARGRYSRLVLDKAIERSSRKVIRG